MSHICDTCGAGATTARRLLDHRRKHQLVASVSIEGVSQNLERFSEQEVWVCPVQACPFTSLNIGSLRNHVKTHRAATPDAPSPSVSLCRSSLPSSQSSDPLLPPLQNASESGHHEAAAQQDLQCSSSRETRDAGEARRRAARTTLPCRQLADAGKTPLHLTKTLKKTPMQKAAPTTARSTKEKTAAARRAQTHSSPLKLDLQQQAFTIFNPCT